MTNEPPECSTCGSDYILPDPGEPYESGNCDKCEIESLRKELRENNLQVSELRKLMGHWSTVELALKAQEETNRLYNECFKAGQELNRRITAALNELGVPGPDYPAPVANAVDILKNGPKTNDLGGFDTCCGLYARSGVDHSARCKGQQSQKRICGVPTYGAGTAPCPCQNVMPCVKHLPCGVCGRPTGGCCTVSVQR